MALRELFGGAITALAPKALIDASDLREVPDTQEVFMYTECGVSIVVEILQKVDASTFEDAAKFHFNSLAHDNEAASTEIQSVLVIPNDRGEPTPSATRLVGTQQVQKFNRTELDDVLILMALYRVEDKNVDVVVTFNVPTKSIDGGAVSASQLDSVQTEFDAFIRSFQILDFGLFA